MIKNYLKTALRNLFRYKGFSLINILGLSIGITGCLLIGLFVWDEWQYDKNIPGGKNVYRIYNERTSPEGTTYMAPVPPAYATYLEHQYPEVDTAMRILMTRDRFLMEYGDKKGYEEKGWVVESSFFKMFPLKMVAGNAEQVLDAPASIVISEDLAQKYFGHENPIGKTIKIDRGVMNVTGVFANLPAHFHLDFHFLMALSSTGIPKERMELWTWNQFYTYIKVKPGTDIRQLQNKFQAYVDARVNKDPKHPGTIVRPHFQSLKDIHLASANFVYDNAIRGNETYVKALTIIAIFVLVIACFNFINLATARSLRRAKEIGVRKVAGANRRQLILQFIGETVLLSTASVFLAAIATIFLVPMLNQFTGKAIVFNPFTSPILSLIMLFSGVIIGILAGIYPALILSGFQPVRVLKNIKVTGGPTGGVLLRKALVVIQFTLSILLITSAMIVYQQTKYLNNKDLGFNKEQVISFQLRDSLETNAKTLETFKNELKNFSGILSVTSGYGLPGDQFAGDGVNIGDEKKEHSANVFVGDEDYVKTLGLRIIAGRDFSRNMPTDIREAFLINESAVKEFGFGSPEKAIGQSISWNEWAPSDTSQPVKNGKVIGVIQDFHYKSLHEKITASVIQLYPQVSYKVAVKLRTADIKTALAYINDTWTKFVHSYPLDYHFIDESYGQMYGSEQRLSELLWIFTVMAIFVGCMGLFGLAAFNAEQKVKEIGIRKVLGANAGDIITLLSGNFVVLIIVSLLLASPIAWWAMNKWLEDFAYKVNISGWVFVTAGVAALFIALLTISFQAIKAAVANPVRSLRTE